MKDQYEQGALVKRALGYRLQWLVWVAIVATFGLATAGHAQDASGTITVTDNSTDQTPSLWGMASGECKVYNVSAEKATGVRERTSDIYDTYVNITFPDRGSISAAETPVSVLTRSGPGSLGSSNAAIVDCDGKVLPPAPEKTDEMGNVVTAARAVHEIALELGESCELHYHHPLGIVELSGTLSKTHADDAKEPIQPSDHYYEFTGSCIVVGYSSSTAPLLASITRTTGDTAGSTESSVSWIVKFTENVSDVNEADFEISGASGMELSVKKADGEADFGYEVTASGGDFTDGNPAFLKLAANNDIKEVNGMQQKVETKDGFPYTNDNYYCYESCTSATTTGKNTKVETNKGILTSLKEEDISTFSTDKPTDMNFDLGTYSYKVENLSTTAADTVTITLTLANDVPADAKIYKVTSSNYIELGSANNLVINGKTVKFDITDNGALDTDNTLGVIADPVTIGTPSSTTGTTATTTSSGSGSVGIIGLLFGSALFGLAVYRRRARSA